MAAGPIDKHIGERIRLRRIELDLRLVDLAEKCQVKYQNLSRYELGRHPIPASTLLRLADVLEVSIDYFYEDLETEHEGKEFVRNFEGLSDFDRTHVLDITRRLAELEPGAPRQKYVQ